MIFYSVICRFRPVNEREKSEGTTQDGALPLLEYPNDATVVVNINKQPPQTFNFDRVFGSDSKQVRFATDSFGNIDHTNLLFYIV